MSSSESLAIKLEGVAKCYNIYDKPHHRLLQMLYRGRRSFGRSFWALNGVSLEVKRGETLGIVGRNGSGKSTLLQIICGTLSPTQGSVSTSGRVAALLELGSGFNPDFTGRENVLMNAALLGLSPQEIEDCYPRILEFADIGDFIEQPVKTYSTGMVVRLAFAVQAQISPDILIVDEALAVGDACFQAKCFSRLNQLRERGTTVLLVTHSTEQVVSHCSRAVLLDGGRIVDSGEPRRVVNRYLDLLFGVAPNSSASVEDASQLVEDDNKSHEKPAINLSTEEDLFATRPLYNPHEYRWGDGRGKIIDFYLGCGDQLFPGVIQSGSLVSIGLSIAISEELSAPVVGVTIKTKEGITVYGTNTEMLGVRSSLDGLREGGVVNLEGKFRCNLAPGDYFISVGLANRNGEEEVVPVDRRYDSIHLQVASKRAFLGVVDLNLEFQ
jgi:lipopolysaccharide transport system ATP-binding protein